VVADQQAVEVGGAGRRGHLEPVARLLGRVVRAHRPLDERARRRRGQGAPEGLVGRRRGGEQEAERRAELHATATASGGAAPRPAQTSSSPLDQRRQIWWAMASGGGAHTRGGAGGAGGGREAPAPGACRGGP